MMRAFLTVYHPFAYYLSFCLFGVFGLALNGVCLLLGWLPARPGVERFFQALLHRLFALWIRWLSFARLVRFRFDGFERLPATLGLVLVSNHPGLMDVTYLLAKIPRGICAFKPAIRRNPVLGAAARRAGYLASDGGHDFLRAAAEKVAAGDTFIVFPEGTRTASGALHPFKSGFVLVARRARAPIQLVRIACDAPLLAKGRPWWRVPPLPAEVSVALGPLLPPPTDEKNAEVGAWVEAWFRAEVSGPAAISAVARFPRPENLQPAS
jgi:1-acyl-sn-glycerol-3-phosphate acyltransferase